MIATAPQTHVVAYTYSDTLVSLKVHTPATRDVTEDPFGNTIRATGTAATNNAFRFSTKYEDKETGLLYYGFRFYSPTIGRFLSRDPLGDLQHYAPGSIAVDRNLYLLVSNDPVRGVDILGLMSCCGPDVTHSINEELSRLKEYLLAAPMIPDSSLYAIYNISRLMMWFRYVAMQLDYESEDPTADPCPTLPDCEDTITLCGRCVVDDVPGNIMFGYAAYYAGIPDLVRDWGAAVAEMFLDVVGDYFDPPVEWYEDIDEFLVFDYGAILARSGSEDICDVMGSSGAAEAGPPGCGPCGREVEYEPAELDPARYPAYISSLTP